MKKIVGDVVWLLYICCLMLWLFTILCWHQLRIAVRRTAARADAKY